MVCRRREGWGRHHGLPRPRVNHYVEGRERDFVFAAQRVVIETDSWTHHRTRRSFEDDRHRDQLLARAGWRTVRFTHRQLTHAQDDVAATLATLLSPQPGYADPMSEQSSGGAGETAREMREHEQAARERDADERDPETGSTDPRGDEPAPPGNVQTGEVSGGS